MLKISTNWFVFLVLDLSFVLYFIFITLGLLFQTKAEDTSAAQARDGKDIQGIPWERLSVTRQKYRKTRLDQYKNYENIPDSGESAAKVSYIFHASPCFSTRS